MSEIEQSSSPIEDPGLEQGEEELSSRSLPPVVKLLILLMSVLLLAGGAFIITQKVIRPWIAETFVGEKMEVVKQKLQKPKKKKKKKGPIIQHQIAGITTNTAGSLGRRFVTVDLIVETTSEEAQEEMIAKEYRIRDALIFYFGGRTIQEISTREFMTTARDTLRSLINSIIESDPVDTVFFTNFLIQ